MVTFRRPRPSARSRIVAQMENAPALTPIVPVPPADLRFPVIYADPPWPFSTWSPRGEDRSAARHYRIMSLPEIEALGPQIEGLAARDSVLFLWVTSPQLEAAFAVMEAWGFVYRSLGFCWVKTTAAGGEHLGLGYWTRIGHELCLIGTRGSPGKLRRAQNVHSVVTAPVQDHSTKPEEVRHRIMSLIDGPYLELFARRRVDGWYACGDELPAPWDDAT